MERESTTQSITSLCREFHAQESSEFKGIENCIQNIITSKRWNLLIKILSMDKSYMSVIESNQLDEVCMIPILYELLKFGNIELVQRFTQHKDESELELNFSKMLEHLYLKGVKLKAPMEDYIQQRLFLLRFQEENANTKLTAPSQQIKQKDAEERRKFTFKLIEEISAYGINGEVNDSYLLKLEFISQNMMMLKYHKKKLEKEKKYRELPWNEVQFLVAMFISFYKNQDTLSGFMFTFDKKRLLQYLQLFNDTTLKSKDMNEIKRDIDEIKRDFKLAKCMYSIGKINSYIKLAKDIDLDRKSEVGKCVIERTIQVVGEFLKCSNDSPNIPKYLESIFEDSAPSFLKDVRQVRDCVSHSEYLETRSGVSIDTYKGIQNELREMYPKIVNILYIQEYLRYKTVFEEGGVISETSYSNTHSYTDNYITLGLLKFVVRNCDDADKKQIVKNHYFNNLLEHGVLIRFFEIIKNIYDSEIIRDAMLFSSKEGVQLLQEIFKLITNKPYYAKILRELQQALHAENETSVVKKTDAKSNLKIVFDRFKKLGIKTMTMQNFKADENLKIAFEMLTLDVLNIYEVEQSHLIDAYYPMLLAKNLRNHLAHGNLLNENLPNITSIFYTAKYFTNNTNAANTKIALKAHHSVNFQTRYTESLKIVETQSAMYDACRDGSVEEVKKCIQDGADINGRNCIGFSAFDFAAESDNVEVFKYLESVSTITNVDRLYETCIKNNSRLIFGLILERYKNYVHNYKYLHMASCKNSTFMIEELIRNGADVNAKGINNLTALHIAVLLSHSNIVEILLKNKADVALKDDRGNTPLHVAALMGHNQFIETLQDVINSRNNLERTPLHQASSNGHLSVVQTLLRLGANIDARDKSGKTPFHLAAEFGREDVVIFLIEKSADIRAVTGSRQSAVHLSARNGHLEILKRLFKENSEDAKCRDYEGNTAFHLAIKCNREEVVEYLLGVGASVSHCNNYGQNPLGLAIDSYNMYCLLKKHPLFTELRSGFVETDRYCSNAVDIKNHSNIKTIISVVNSMDEEYVIDEQTELLPYLDENERKLLLLNASFHGNICPIIALRDAEIRFTDEDIEKAFQLAALKGQIETFTVLFETYSSYFYKMGNFQITRLLHYAAINGNDNIIEFLIGKGIDINTIDRFGWTGLYLAIREYGSIQGIEVLLKKKANVHSKDEFGNSLLHYAVYRDDYLEIMKVLIKYGANVNAKNKKKKSVLYCAMMKRNFCLQAVKLLIDNGANEKTSVFKKNGYKWYIIDFIKRRPIGNNGKTALHYAAENNDELDAFKFLIDNGLDCNAVDVDHKTALHYAVQHTNNLEIIQFLISNGADINAIDRMGKSASHYAACCKHNSNVLKYLSKNGANFNLEDAQGKSALTYAMKNDTKFDTMTVLTENGFAKDIDLNIFLYSVFLYKRNLEEIKFLVNIGANHSEISNHLDDTPISKINLILIQLLNGCSVDLNAKDENGNTVLLCAIKEGYDLSIIKWLVNNNGANCNVTNNTGKSTLYYSLKKKRCFEEIEFLIENGAECNAVDCNGRSVLHEAVQILYRMRNAKNDEEINSDNDDSYFFPTYEWAEMEYDQKISVENLMSFDVMLHSYYLKIIQLLVNNGANVNAKDTTGKSVLHYAIESEHCDLALVEFLISNGADCNAKDKNGKFLLHSAVGRKNNLTIVQVLIKNGAYLNSIDNKGRTPLHYAVTCQNNLDIVKFLISNGGDCNSRDNFGRSVLHYVVRPRYNFYNFFKVETWWNLDILEFLLDKGADCNAKDHNAQSVLHYVADFEPHDFYHRNSRAIQRITEFLLLNGADCNAKDRDGKSVLHYAAKSGLEFKIIKILINNVNDLNEADNDGKSLLHYAAGQKHNLDLINYLCNIDADFKVEDKFGKAAWQYAAKFEYLFNNGLYNEEEDLRTKLVPK